jgi:CHRD domain
MALNSRRLLAVVVLALLVALALALPVSATDKKFVPPKKHVTTLETVLTGEQEVPGPGDRDGVGRAVVKVFKTKVCYKLAVKRIKPATDAHIHIGFRGEAGPIVVTLEPPTDGFSRGCVAIPRALSLGLMEHPERYYVNVHNEPFPDGAIRGQLHR